MAISISARQRVTSGLWGGRKAGSFEGRAEVAPPADDIESFSGGWLSLPDYTRGRDEYVRRQRIALGILPSEQIEQAGVIPEAVAVAAQAVVQRTRGVRMRSQQREAELRAEVERTQAWKDDYAAALYAELYRAEVQRREDDLIVALLAA